MRTRAFSLIELLVVVVVLGIVGSLAMPMFRGTDRTRLNAAAALMIADFAYAQSESLSHGGDPRVIVLAADGTGYHLAAASDPDTPLPDRINGGGYAVTFGQRRAGQLTNVRITGHDLDGDAMLGFDRYGGLDQATAAKVTLGITTDDARG